jgi:hypothetical protein
MTVVTRHKKPYDASQDESTKQLRKMLEVQIWMLKERLKDYADLLVPADEVPSFLSTLDKVYEQECKYLLEGEPGMGIAYYEFAPRYTEEDFAGGATGGRMFKLVDLKDHITVPEEKEAE